MSWKHLFSRSIGRDGAPLHFAAHSHHPWPDVTFAAHAAYWELSARALDRKWEDVLGAVMPKAAAHVARTLSLPDPSTIAFAPNTHELVMRVLSTFPAGKHLRVLTTDAEFHSFARQLARLEEEDAVRVTRVASQTFATFSERFAAAAKDGFDLVYLSNVFFDSGFHITDLGALVAALPKDALVLVDGYHAFMALPVDLSAIASRVLYVAGGYKYAMAGEGAAFLHAPPGVGPRPRDTGWYAGFDALEKAGSGVAYPADARRFLGATFDPSGLFRFNAVQDLLAREGLNVAAMTTHARDLQAHFLDALARSAAKGFEASPRPQAGPHRALSHLRHAARWRYRIRARPPRHHRRPPRHALARRLRDLSG